MTHSLTILLSVLATATVTASDVTLLQLQKDPPQPREMVYRTVGGRDLHIYVYQPAGNQPGDHTPAILTIHGGGWAGGDPSRFVPHCLYFASRGMVAINIQYRLITKPKDPGPRVCIQDCIADCQAAVRFVRANAKELGVDPNRIAVIGDSAGGHLAAALGVIPDVQKPDRYPEVSSRVNAMIPCNPVLDLLEPKWMRASDPNRCAPPSPEAMTVEQRARSVSPMYFIDETAPPCLLIHGTADTVVDIAQAEKFARQMKEAGVRCDFHRMEGWKHAFILPNVSPEEQVVGGIRLSDEFLRSLGYLQGEPTLQIDPEQVELDRKRAEERAKAQQGKKVRP